MKHLFIILALVLGLTTARSQTKSPKDSAYFEGVITYSVTFKGDSDLIYNVKRFVGTVSQVYYYEGNSIQTSNAVKGSEYILIPSQKKYYILPYFNSDSISWVETTKKDSVLEYELLKDTVEVLGIKCNILKIKTRDDREDATTLYYYNKKALPINPAWTKDITYLAGGFVDSIIQSYPLVNLTVSHRLDDMEIILTATKIERKSVREIFKKREQEINRRLKIKK